MEVERVDILVLFLNYRKCFQLFTVECEVGCAYVISAIILLRYVPSIPTLMRIVIS